MDCFVIKNDELVFGGVIVLPENVGEITQRGLVRCGGIKVLDSVLEGDRGGGGLVVALKAGELELEDGSVVPAGQGEGPEVVSVKV